MKKLFTLIFICACFTPLFAQKYNKAMIDSYHFSSEKRSGKGHSGLNSSSATYLKLKSVNVAKQRLDSVTRTGYKEIYRYNDAGQLTFNHLSFYNADGSFGWRGYTGKYEYDNQGRISISESYSLQEGGFESWLSGKTMYNYLDETNVETDSYGWNSETEDWEIYSKSFLVLDNKGRIVEEKTKNFVEFFDSLVWQHRVTRQYNANGDLSTAVVYDYHYWKNTWIQKQKDEYTYDDMNRPLEAFSFNWNEDDQKWINSSRFTDLYQNDQYKESGYIWMNNAWQLDWEEVYNLSSDGTPTEILYNYYGEGGLGYSEKMIPTYNKQYEYSDLLLPRSPRYLYDFSGGWSVFDDYNANRMNKMLTAAMFYEFDFDSNSWNHDGWLNTYHYSNVDVASALDKVSSKSVMLYPNPTKSSITISGFSDFENVEINLYSAAGAVVLQQTINSQTPLSVAHLNPGMYLYQIKTTDKVFTGKVLID